MNGQFRDLVTCVLEHAASEPERPCTTIVSHRSKEESRTYGQLAEAAGRAAAWYQAAGLQRGDRVVFLGTHHIDLYAAWLGCVWCGGVPAILAEPSARIDRTIYWSRLNELLQRIEAWGIVVDPRVRREGPLAEGRRTAEYPEVVGHVGPVPTPFRPAPDDLMLLQHSSGTTGVQKGVMLTHGAVSRHAESYHARLRPTRDDVVATWLPLYHDMGFIACFVDALRCGMSAAWLSPFEWVANPALLLDAVTRHRATLMWLPNFAFAFLAQRVAPGARSYDLSSLRAVVNCSEPVTAAAIDAFVERFAADGLNPAAVQTCYAMAENVFAVTTTDAESPPQRRRIDRRRWLERHEAIDSADDDAKSLVSSGRCVPDCEVRIVDAAGRALPSDIAGEIQIRSPFLFAGYFRRDELNDGLFDAAGFYTTGDTGFLDAEGRLYVTGRTKDLVIVGGKNVYPQDVEQAAVSAGAKAGRVVCFGVRQREPATEGIVVLAESDEPEATWEEIARRIRTAAPAALDVDLLDVRIVTGGLLRKSTSGKLARDGNRQWYLSGKFGPPAENVVFEESS